MKPTSLIFLAFSVFLILGGLITCKIGKSMSAKQGIRLYDQEFDENGDLVYVYNVSDAEISKISLTFDSVDVNVVVSEKNYVEIKNFKPNDFTTSRSGGTVSIDGTSGFFSSLIDTSSGGIQFKGLRYFLLDDPAPDSKKSVTVYLSEESQLQKLNISVTNADIYVKNLKNEIGYSLTTNKGNIDFSGINCNSVAELSSTDGNVNISDCAVLTISSTVKNGDFNYKTGSALADDMIDYNITVNDGTVTVGNTELEESKYMVTSPISKVNIKAYVMEGNAYINS